MLKIKNIQHVLTDHCNLHCAECSTHSNVLSKNDSNLDNFKKDILKLSQYISTKSFEFVGGEPLLHKNIDDFLEVVKTSNIADRIVVFTNGYHLPEMSDKFFSLVDDINISTYKSSGFNYAKLNKFLKDKQSSINFRFNFDLKLKFQVVHKDLEVNDLVTKKIYNDCKIAHVWKCSLIKDGYYYKCNIPYFKNKYDGFDNKQDGINIHSDEFPLNFYRYLKSEEPLEACKYCNGTSGEYIEHRQLTPQEIKFYKNLPLNKQ